MIYSSVGLDFTDKFDLNLKLENHQIAIGVKATNNVQSHHLKGLRSFSEEYTVNKWMVSRYLK